MNKERLSQMVTMLRNLPEESDLEFHLADWNCGTSACAVGHACLNPVFNEQGLKGTAWGAPRFNGYTSWDAVHRFFCLSTEDARHLFSDDRYPKGGGTTANQVADRIEAFIAA